MVLMRDSLPHIIAQEIMDYILRKEADRVQQLPNVFPRCKVRPALDPPRLDADQSKIVMNERMLQAKKLALGLARKILLQREFFDLSE
jgi:hypothetical protein